MFGWRSQQNNRISEVCMDKQSVLASNEVNFRVRVGFR